MEGGGQRAGLAPRGGRGPLTFSLLLLQEGRRLGYLFYNKRINSKA